MLPFPNTIVAARGMATSWASHICRRAVDRGFAGLRRWIRVTRRLRPEEDLVVGLAIAFVLSMASLFVATLTSREVEILACVALRLSYAVLTSRAVSAAPR
jgi:hypothetical protein